MTKQTITYKELSDRLGNIFMLNNAPEIDPEMELANGSLWENEDDTEAEELKDIFQYYLIGDSDAQYLMEISDEIVFYSQILETYVWGITHYGTSWENVELEVTTV